MSYFVRTDKDLCVSAGKCVADEPTVFAFDADELAEVRTDAAVLSNEALVRLARQCPGRAVLLTDENGANVAF